MNFSTQFMQSCFDRLPSPTHWNTCKNRTFPFSPGEWRLVRQEAHAALGGRSLLLLGDSIGRSTFMLLACLLLPDLRELPKVTSPTWGRAGVVSLVTNAGARVDYTWLRDPRKGSRAYGEAHWTEIQSARDKASIIMVVWAAHCKRVDMCQADLHALRRQAAPRTLVLWEYLPSHFPGDSRGEYEPYEELLQAGATTADRCEPHNRSAPLPWRLTVTRDFARRWCVPLVPGFSFAVGAYQDHPGLLKRRKMDCRHFCNPGMTTLNQLRRALGVLRAGPAAPAGCVVPRGEG